MNFAAFKQAVPMMNPSQVILDLVLQQIHASATEPEMHAFLVAVGRDLALRFPLGDNGDLATFEDRINDVWHRLDMGSAAISLSEDAIHIRHQLPHDTVHPFARRGGIAVMALVEGAYDGWLRASGSGPRLRTTRVSSSAEAVEFRHGA